MPSQSPADSPAGVGSQKQPWSPTIRTGWHCGKRQVARGIWAWAEASSRASGSIHYFIFFNRPRGIIFGELAFPLSNPFFKLSPQPRIPATDLEIGLRIPDHFRGHTPANRQSTTRHISTVTSSPPTYYISFVFVSYIGIRHLNTPHAGGPRPRRQSLSDRPSSTPNSRPRARSSARASLEIPRPIRSESALF